MINKRDLVKEFEEATKQMIINHNAKISQTNETVREFIQKVEGQNSFFKSSLADVERRIVDMQRLHEEHIKQVNLYHQAHTSLSSSISVLQRLIQDLADATDGEVSHLRHLLSNVEKELQKHQEKIIKLNAKVESLEKGQHDYQASWESKLKISLSSLNADISSRPSSLTPKVQEIEKKLEEAYIDFNGVIKELRDLKKKFFIGEKHLEYAHNQIKRLKEKKG